MQDANIQNVLPLLSISLRKMTEFALVFYNVLFYETYIPTIVLEVLQFIFFSIN